MKLSFETIKSITIGAVNIWEEDGGIRFSKMSQSAVEAYYALSNVLGERAETTTGIRFDFITDSPFVAFTTNTTANYEVKVNGFLVAKGAESGVRNQILLPKNEENHVTIYLPSHGVGKIESIEVADRSVVSPCIYDLKMLMIGDSITQGWNSGVDSSSYAYITSENLNANSIIQGVGGAFYDVTTLDALNDFALDIVTVAFGTNDANRVTDLAEFDKICCKYLTTLKEYYSNSKIFVITPIWRISYDNLKPYGHVSLIAQTIKKHADNLGLNVVDGLKLVPHYEVYMNDDIHPNGFGFSEYAKNLTAELKVKL